MGIGAEGCCGDPVVCGWVPVEGVSLIGWSVVLRGERWRRSGVDDLGKVGAGRMNVQRPCMAACVVVWNISLQASAADDDGLVCFVGNDLFLGRRPGRFCPHAKWNCFMEVVAG